MEDPACVGVAHAPWLGGQCRPITAREAAARAARGELREQLTQLTGGLAAMDSELRSKAWARVTWPRPAGPGRVDSGTTGVFYVGLMSNRFRS